MLAMALAWSFLHLGSLELRVAVDPAVHCKAGGCMPEVLISAPQIARHRSSATSKDSLEKGGTWL